MGRGETFHAPLAKAKFAAVDKQLRNAFQRLSAKTRVGFDCCLAPAVMGLIEETGIAEHDNAVEGCSATRGSVGITSELDVVPCTFLTKVVLGNLRRESLLEIWQGQNTKAFRRRLVENRDSRAVCRDCKSKNTCLGGCSVMPLVDCAKGALTTGHRNVTGQVVAPRAQREDADPI